MLLTNPEARNAGGANAVARALRAAGAEVTRLALDRAGDAVAAGPDRIVVAGGDGSLAPAAIAARRAGVPLAVVPVGTANDFARRLGLAGDPLEAARVAARGTSTRRLELAWMGERPFLNVASIGLAPVAARRAHGLKRALGPLAYAVGAVRAGVAARPVHCRIAGDDEELFAGEVWQATVAASGAFGGGAEVDADPADGLLDVVAVEAGPRLALLARAWGLRHGRVEGQRGVRSWRLRAVELEVAAGTAFNVDGEVVESGPARFEAQVGAIEVVVG